MAEYAVEMLNITKRFPGIIANDNITLQLKKGEIHALLGENGAGKSTLMSVLFGLYQPEEGEIHKDGKWSEYAGKIDSLGMVSDEPSENFVQLPRATTQWADGLFTDADYLQLVKDIHGGKITISNDITAMPSVSITVNDYGSIK